MRVIIIDDEPRAIKLLSGYLSHFNTLELLATFRNGLKAIDFISKNKVDVIFLDINMPHISGLSLSKIISKEIKVVFTTAYSEFAAESYEVNAIDYLLKPITLERFSITISRLLNASITNEEEPEADYLMIKTGNKFFRLLIDDLLYLKKEGNYITYYSGEQNVLARQTIAESLENLPSNFIQVHKSYIINTNKISVIEKDFVFVQNESIPIGASFKKLVMERILP